MSSLKGLHKSEECLWSEVEKENNRNEKYKKCSTQKSSWYLNVLESK